jgi:hypothetical protein
MFEVTAEDVGRLSDEDLRSLVALLCEAEMRMRGLPVSAVTWGGNQTAPDGGIDVRVALPAGTVIDGFVPRPETGFQVKKPDMTASNIGPEMRPEGVLRPSIRDLAERSGAYIIVSSGANTSDTALQDRRDAMAVAVARIKNRAALLLDFYAERGSQAGYVITLAWFCGCGTGQAARFRAGGPMKPGRIRRKTWAQSICSMTRR